jgi:hypothetical protein
MKIEKVEKYIDSLLSKKLEDGSQYYRYFGIVKNTLDEFPILEANERKSHMVDLCSLFLKKFKDINKNNIKEDVEKIKALLSVGFTYEIIVESMFKVGYVVKEVDEIIKEAFPYVIEEVQKIIDKRSIYEKSIVEELKYYEEVDKNFGIVYNIEDKKENKSLKDNEILNKQIIDSILKKIESPEELNKLKEKMQENNEEMNNLLREGLYLKNVLDDLKSEKKEDIDIKKMKNQKEIEEKMSFSKFKSFLNVVMKKLKNVEKKENENPNTLFKKR